MFRIKLFLAIYAKSVQTSKWYMSEALVTQLYPTLCDPVDCSPPVSSVHGILQAGVLEWIVMPFSSGSSQSGIESVSCTSGSFCAIWATREAPVCEYT